ncbi:MAG TPA: hypothetical protein VGB13_04075, partial [Candidatus Krumholzibacteria bacterium]
LADAKMGEQELLHTVPFDRRHDPVLSHQIDNRRRRHRDISDTPGKLVSGCSAACKQPRNSEQEETL